jgi:hypothetical protein
MPLSPDCEKLARLMWKQLLEFGKEILGIRQRLQQQEETIKQLSLDKD